MKGRIISIIPFREQTPEHRDRGGYGFIRGEDGRERFFHARDVVEQGSDEIWTSVSPEAFGQLRRETPVEFDCLDVSEQGPNKHGRSNNGLRAEFVRIIR